VTRPQGNTLWWTLVIALSVAIVAAASLGAWQFVVKSAKPPPPVANNAAARQVVIDAAKANVVKLYTYRPDTFDRDLAAAEAVLTDEFRESYNKIIGSVRDAIVQTGVTSTATASDGAVESLKSDSAAIIIFGKKTTTTRDQPTPQDTAF
jgi:Mce-associated membrane protein